MSHTRTDRGIGSAQPVTCESCGGRHIDIVTTRTRRILGIPAGQVNAAWDRTCWGRATPSRDLHLWWIPTPHPTTWGALLESLPVYEDDVWCTSCRGFRGPVLYAAWPPFGAADVAAPFCGACSSWSTSAFVWAWGTTWVRFDTPVHDLPTFKKQAAAAYPDRRPTTVVGP